MKETWYYLYKKKSLKKFVYSLFSLNRYGHCTYVHSLRKIIQKTGL